MRFIFEDVTLEACDAGARGALSRVAGDDRARQERCLVSLSGAMVDACRNAESEEEVASYLESEHALGEEVARAVAGVAGASRARILQALQRVAGGDCLPQLRDAQWRLDVNVGQNDTSKSVREPLFHINLATSAEPKDPNAAARQDEEVSRS